MVSFSLSRSIISLTTMSSSGSAQSKRRHTTSSSISEPLACMLRQSSMIAAKTGIGLALAFTQSSISNAGLSCKALKRYTPSCSRSYNVPQSASTTCPFQSSGENIPGYGVILDVRFWGGLLRRWTRYFLACESNIYAPRKNLKQTLQVHQAQDVTPPSREHSLRAIEYGHILDLSAINSTLLKRHSSTIAAPPAASVLWECAGLGGSDATLTVLVVQAPPATALLCTAISDCLISLSAS